MSRMTLDRFRELLDRHGSDLERWPSADAADAAHLLRDHTPALVDLEEARGLDRALRQTRPAAPLPALRERILRALPARAGAPRPQLPWWRILLAEIGGWRVAGPAFAAALTLGVALGFGLSDPVSLDLVELAGFGELDSEYR